MELTLLRSGSEWADPRAQVRLLEGDARTPAFVERVQQAGAHLPRACGIDVLQVNVGKVCNQTCTHCHVDAGPDRRESLSAELAEACLDLLRRTTIGTLDITGGAPEMNPSFRRLVTGARALGRRVIDRCNLTILVAPGYTDLPDFLAEYEVEIVASLPCYLETNVDKQRGDRVFQRSLDALRKLNALGYGQPGSSRSLTLVYNPTGAALPPPQDRLEADYRRELRTRYGIEFTRLFTITNMPISRFLADLVESGRYDQYMDKLVAAFNPATLPGLMCRTMLSVDWQGRLFDCDFNQMLDLEIFCEPSETVGGARSTARSIRDLDDATLASLAKRHIVFGQHCYGCTAGAGSSCSGSLS
jgi:radical SAM/Cys-rich protein